MLLSNFKFRAGNKDTWFFKPGNIKIKKIGPDTHISSKSIRKILLEVI